MTERYLFWLLGEAKRRQWCCHCKHWDPDGEPSDIDQFGMEYVGYCRRQPPSFHRLEGQHDAWPLTNYFDWCGEYALNKTPALAQYIEELAHAQPTDEQP